METLTGSKEGKKKMDETTKKLNRRQKAILRFIKRYIEKKGYPPTVREIGKGVGLSSSSTVHFNLNSLERLGFIERDPTKTRAIRTINIQEIDILNKGDKEAESDLDNVITASQVKRDELSNNYQEQKFPDDAGKNAPIEDSANHSIIEHPENENLLLDHPAKGDLIEHPASQNFVNPTPNQYIIEYPLINWIEKDVSFFDERNIESVIPLPVSLVGNSDGFLMRMRGESMTGIGVFDGDICIIRKSDEFEDGNILAVISNGEVTIKRVFRHLGAYRLDPENRRMTPIYVREIEVLGKLIGIIRTW